MSAKGGNKPAAGGRARERRTSVYSNRLRKKRDGTPEKSATPSQEPDENLTPSRNVIWNEEIEKLQIKPDELYKVWPPRPPSEERKVQAVKVPVKKMKKQSQMEKPKSRMVSVAKPAPPDAPLQPRDYSGYAGPRYDDEGNVVLHSLLGTYEDFHREATRRGDLPERLPSPKEGERAETPSLKYEKQKKGHQVQLSQDENNALRNWQLKMIERKRQQGYISKLLQKAPEDLAMNQADHFRCIQEQRYLLDRTIPKVDYGKGYRVGSEFWYQQEQFGDDITGLHMTLSQSQRGYPAPVERVGLPQTVKEEKGCEWLGKRNPHMNYPWHKSRFLEQRQKELQPFLEEMEPFQPDFSALQVIGSNKPLRFENEEEEKKKGEEEEEEDDDNFNMYGAGVNEMPLTMDLDKSEYEEGDPHSVRLEGEEDKKDPVFGPSLLFGGQPARWTGDSFSLKDQVGIEARVTFEALTGDRITSYLELINDGTTSIYYDWKKMSKENPFDLVQKVVQRFYFNNSSGVILPGETLKFPFVFKSPNAGVFTEQWRLETRPVVCGGAALLVTLRGVALQEDKYKGQREMLEKELVQKQAHQVVSQLLHELVSGVRTPERSRSPVDAYITEEEIFCRNNPGLYYRHEEVAQLQALHTQMIQEELRAETFWNLSVQDLQENILELDDDDERKEVLLLQMNAVLAKLSYVPPKPVTQQMQAAGYQLFMEAVDRIVGESMLLRSSMCLPDRAQDDIDGDANRLRSSDSRKGRGNEKAKGEQGKDKGKPGAKDAKQAKGKEPAKPDPKGKTTPAPAKKAATPVKATPARIPTPGDKDAPEGSSSQPSSPDLSSSAVMNDAELAVTEALYKDTLTVQAYNILGDMLDQMDMIFSAIKTGQGD